MGSTVSRERVLAILYDMAMVIGGEIQLKPLLTKTLQRLLYHTSFPAGVVLFEEGRQAPPLARIEVVLGDYGLSRYQGGPVALPPALLRGEAEILDDGQLLAALPGSDGRYRAALRLPIGQTGAILLLAPSLPPSDLPLTQVFQPVMANLAKSVLLCRHHEAYTEALLTDRNQARADLAREMERVVEERTLLRTLYNALPDLVWLKDADSRYIACNRVFEALCGRPEAEVLGQQDLAFFPTAQVAGFREQDRQATVNGVAINEERFTYPDGRAVLVETIRTAVRRSDGSLIGILGVARDITERKRLEAELRAFNQELEQRVEEEVARNREKDHLLIQQSRLAAMGEMIHNIAHQWRQPLNALAIVLSNVEDDFQYGELTAERLADAVARSRRLLEKMSSTIDDFRDFFRPDREPGDFDVGVAVEDALFILESSLKNNRIELVRDLPHGLIAFGHANQFAQAVLNVVANAKEAIKARGVEAGRIELRLRGERGRALLSVIDNAGGIPETILPRIFEPYFTTKEQGSGIGLYMTKMIMERNLQGRVEARNIAGGALFTFSLPLLRREESP